MTTPSFSFLILLGFTAAGTIFLSTTAPKATTVAAHNELTDDQRLAFAACHQQMAGKALLTRNAHGIVKRYEVPDEICVCQARAMAAKLKPDGLDAHRLVVDHKMSGAQLEPLPLQSLKTPPAQAGDTSRALASALKSCIDDFQRAQEAKTEAVKRELIARQRNANL